MDTVKLEAKWPPDRRCTIEASEFGIYKEPDDGKRRLRGTDRATGCLLVVSLLAAAAVVVYFMFFDYTIPSTQAAASTGGPIVSYAKYVKSKQSTSAAGLTADRSTDGFLGAMLAVQKSENYTSTADDGPQTADGDESAGGARHARMYHRTPPRRSAYAAYGPDYDYWRTAADVTAGRDGRLEYSDGIYGFNRRSDFPQLAAYRAPFPPKSVVEVMKYVTGRPPRRKPIRKPPASQHPPPQHPSPQHPSPQHPPPRDDFMVAQESSLRYVPIRPAEEVNVFLPDAVAPAKGNSKRFRNKFGPPVYLTPPRVALPDDFMKPPERDAGYSTSFTAASDAATAQHHDVSSAGSVLQSYTDVVYRSPAGATRYAVPDSPAPSPSPSPPSKKAKRNRHKGNKKPISVMLDIYPMPGGREDEREQESEEEEEEEENEEENTSPDIRTSLKSNLQQSDVDDLLYRLNLLSKLNEGGRRLTKSLKKSEEQDVQTPTIYLTTESSLKDEEEKDSDETFKWPAFEYAQESKIIANTLKSIKKHS